MAPVRWQPLAGSRDGRWYRFAKRAGRGEIVAPPADAPDELVGAALSHDDR